jgi:hypothetical protein
MKKALIFLVFFFVTSGNALADITFTNGFWSTSFIGCGSDLNICTAGCGFSVSCDGNSPSCADDLYAPFPCGDTSCSGDTPSQILNAANNPNGEGGRGYRMYVGPGAAADQSAYPAIDFQNLSEFWLRFYIRVSSNMSKTGKTVFPNMTNGCQPYWVATYGSDWNVIPQNCGSSGGTCGNIGSNCNWLDVTDGNWHYIEVHYRVSGSTLMVESWFDNTYGGSLTTGVNATYFNHSKFVQSIKNETSCSCPSACTVDLDDFAMALRSYTGFVKDAGGRDRIGPLGGGGGGSSTSGPPSPPTLHIK